MAEEHIAGPAGDEPRAAPHLSVKIGIDTEELTGRTFPYQFDRSLVDDVDLIAATPGKDLNWLEDVHLMYEDGVPAVFDRYTNAFLKIHFEIPEGREDEYARKVRDQHLARGQLLRHLAQAPPREVRAARAGPVAGGLGHGGPELAARRGAWAGAPVRSLTQPAPEPTRAMTSARPAARPVGLPERCDAVVVGGGLLGLSSAYELARRGMSVVLVESGQAGGRQSGRNLGFVRQQGRAPAELPMMMAANQRWRGLAGELGSDVEWRMGGNLRLTNDPEQAGRYERWAADAASLGLDSRVVSRAEMASILPGVTEKWLLGIFTASDGHADPGATCRAYAAALRARGVQVCEGVPVRKITVAGGSVTGVTTPFGELKAGVVVLAAGSSSARLARGAAIEIPQQLVSQTVILTAPVPA